MDKADRKTRSKAWRERECAAARERLPLDDAEMEALFDTLDERLRETGCDHTRRLTDAWLAQRGLSLDSVHRWLDENGGHCDCEALANSEEAWRAARGRS